MIDRMSHPLLTMIVPTFNRPQYIRRFFQYYSARQCPYSIIIADSSSEPSASANYDIISSHQSSLNIQYQKYDSSLVPIQKLAKVVENTESKYVVLCSDDDFIIQKALDQCLAFLEQNPDYSLAHGSAVWLLPASPDANPPPNSALDTAILQCVASMEEHPELPFDRDFTVSLTPDAGITDSPSQNLIVKPYRQRTIDNVSPSKRLENHLDGYSTTYYSMQRRNSMLKNLRLAVSLTEDYRFGELLPSCLSIIQGKAKCMDSLYLVREWHANSTATGVATIFDLLTGNDYSSRYMRFRNCLAEELMAGLQLSAEEAEAVVNKSFLQFLGGMFHQNGIGKTA